METTENIFVRTFKRFWNFVCRHKVVSIIVAAVVVLAIAGGIAYGLDYQKRYNNSQKMLELAARSEGVSEEELEAIENDGGSLEFGEEVVDPNTGETVVLTVNEDGTVQRTVVKDSNGNATGATVPEDHSAQYYSGGGSGGGSSSGGGGSSSGGGDNPGRGSSGGGDNPRGGSGGGGSQPAEHSHNWQPHYATRTVEHTTAVYVVDSPATPAEGHWVSHTCCNVCDARDVKYGVHKCKNGLFGTYELEEYVVTKQAQPEKGYYQNVTTTSQEQYIDYYVCSCGARQ